MKRKGLFIIALLLVLIFSACSVKEAKEITTDDNANITKKITDTSGRTVVIPTEPNKIVVLSTSNLNLLYELGGEAVGRVKTSSPIPEEARNVPEIGTTSKPNQEAIVSLKPDLVIGTLHDAKLVDSLAAVDIPIVFIRAENYNEGIRAIELMGEIVNKNHEARALIEGIKDNVKKVTDKVPRNDPKVLVLMGSSKRFLVALPNSFSGDLVSMLGGINVSEGETPTEEGGNYTPFSMEAIISWDPDIILTLSHGNPEIMKDKMTEDFGDNKAWNNLTAVRTGRIYHLPYDLFVIKPVERLDKAVEHLAKTLYPEVF